MTIYYLYVKTHNKTGLKYLGQTKQKDPHKYPGSGTYWELHLKKHGKDYTTEILHECQSLDEIKEKGLYYSRLWNVIESNKWANLKEEAGEGGGAPGPKSAEWRVNQVEAKKRLVQDPEWRANIAKSNRRKAQDPEWRAKVVDAIENKYQDPEYRARQAEGIRKKYQDPEYRARQAEGIRKYHQLRKMKI